MTMHQWSAGLAAAGLITLPSLVRAEEKLSPVLTALSTTTISGYVSTSAQWNPGTGNANPPNIAFNQGKQDGFNLDVVKLTLERPLEEAQWSAGYKVDLFLGPDANTFASQSTAAGGTSDFAVRQAFVDLKVPVGNGLEFKLGVWDPIMGYEVTDAPNNRNYTRSYGYFIEPISHTGLLATYPMSSWLTLNAGVANTFGPTINQRAFPTALDATNTRAESYKSYMGSIVLTAPDSLGFLKGSTAYLSAMNGFDTLAPVAPGGGKADQTSLYAGATLNTPITNLKVGVAVDYVFIAHQPLTADKSFYADAYGLYVNYQLTEKLSLNGRGEYASTDANGYLTPSRVSTHGAKVIELTGTLQYDVWKNVLSRLEFRWDHAADGQNSFGGRAPGNPSSENAFVVAANMVYKF
jgi:hypothetical protein